MADDEMATVRKADLDMLVAVCTSYLPAGISPDVLDAFERMMKVFDEAHGIEGEMPGPESPAGDGYWACIAFMGHNEHTGYVTEIVKNGQPAYQVDLPDKIWGGDQASSVKYAASAWFSERLVSGESVRAQWKAEVAARARRAREEAEWRDRQNRALPAGPADDDDEDLDDDDPDGDQF